MKKKIEITAKQAEQFNKMLRALRMIAGHKGNAHFMTTDQLREEAAKADMGIDFEEAIEMAYDNIQTTAKFVSKGVREIQIPKPFSEEGALNAARSASIQGTINIVRENRALVQ